MKKKQILVILLILIMIISLLPVSAFAGTVPTETNSEINFGLPEEDYKAGEVIVCVQGGIQALAESELFKQNLFTYSGQKADDENFEGLRGSVASTPVSIEENLMSFEAEEKQMDRIAASNDSTYVETLREETADNTSENEQSKTGSQDEAYSLVLLKSGKADVTALIAELEKLPCVKFAEPNGICEPESFAPEDATDEPMYAYQWYSDNTYSAGDTDINATETYSDPKFELQREVVVAVVDSGVDYTHPDLKDAMWDQGDTIPELTALGGGRYGINTSKDGDSQNPIDAKSGHGTHCASTIAATWGNHEGIAGVNGNAKIMACRFMDDAGRGDYAAYIKAMEYIIKAKEKGVNVVAINNSWGGAFSTAQINKTIEFMVEKAAKSGIVSCFAANNYEFDHDRYTNLAYVSPYMLIVGATDSAGNPAYFSERGASTVDVFAPGTQVLAAASLQPDVSEIPPQYLPWLQDDDESFFYEDFENFTNKKIRLSSYQYDQTTGEKSNIAEENTKPHSGFVSSNACEVKIDSDLKECDRFGIEMDIPITAILNNEGKLPDSDTYYMAFQAGVNGFDFKNDNFETNQNICVLEYCAQSGETVQWKKVDSLYGKWRAFDSNWNVFSLSLNKDKMNQLIDAAETTDNTLKLRLVSNISQMTEDASFYLDAFGFGTRLSQYRYEDGTSMATPMTTAAVSLIAGNMSAPTKSEEDVHEIIARIKGGVDREPVLLSDVCTTMGRVRADAAYKEDSELYPVPNTVVPDKDGRTAVINGYFFGNAQGSVMVNGRSVVVNSWSDRKIEIAIPQATEYGLLEYQITRADGKVGREFGVFVNDQSELGSGQYQELTIGDFTYGDKKTKDMIPLRIAANDDGLMAILSNADNTITGLEYYDFDSQTWSQIPQPENIKIEPTTFECLFSIVGGKDQFYLLCFVDSNRWLSTYSTSEKKWLYSINLGPSDNVSTGEFLALDKEGKLLFGGGAGIDSGSNNLLIRQIYPDTGVFTRPLSQLPDEYKAFMSGGDYLISGDRHIIVGLNQGLIYRATDTNSKKYGSPVKAPLVLNDGKWIIKETPFFDSQTPTADGLGNSGLDHDQVYIGAYGALDSGFIMAGPSRNIGKAEMVDTWIYDAEKDTYTALPARVDAMRLKMQAGVCRNGKFYVMGLSTITNEVFLKCLDLSAYDVTSTDPAVNAQLENNYEKESKKTGNIDTGYVGGDRTNLICALLMLSLATGGVLLLKKNLDSAFRKNR